MYWLCWLCTGSVLALYGSVWLMLLLMLLGSFGSFGEAYCRRRFSNATFKAVPELPGDKSSSPELCDAVSHANQFCGRKDSGPELGTSADLSCQVSKFHKALSSELWIAWQSWQWHVVRCLAIKLYQINKAVFASAMWCHVSFASWKDLYRSPRKLVEDRLHSRGRWKSSGGQLLWGVCSPHCFSVLHPFASFAHHILNIHLKHCCHAQLCHTHTQYCHTYTPIHTHNIVTAGVAFMTLGLLGWTGLVWCDASCFLLLMRDRHHLCGRRWATFPWLCVARVAVAPRHIMWQALHVLPLNEAMKYLLCGKHRATLSHKLQHKHTHTQEKHHSVTDNILAYDTTLSHTTLSRTPLVHKPHFSHKTVTYDSVTHTQHWHTHTQLWSTLYHYVSEHTPSTLE